MQRFFYFFLSALILVLQLGAMFASRTFVRQIELLDFGMEAATNAVFTSLLNLVSGVLLAYLLMARWQPGSEDQKRGMFLKGTLLSIFPLLGVVFKILFSAFGPGISPFSFLRLGILEFYEWALFSQVPALWLGLVIGWWIVQTRKPRQP